MFAPVHCQKRGATDLILDGLILRESLTFTIVIMNRMENLFIFANMLFECCFNVTIKSAFKEIM